MSGDPLDAPRFAANTLMASARDRAIGKLRGSAETAFFRADEALRAARTQDEVDRIRDAFISSMGKFGEAVVGLR